jgi:hypothetical protein
LLGSSSSWRRPRGTSSDWFASQQSAKAHVSRDNLVATHREKESTPSHHSQPRHKLISVRLFQHPQGVGVGKLFSGNFGNEIRLQVIEC